MTRTFALLFAVALTLAACSTLNPILKPIQNCAGKTVSASDANEALDDLLTQNWTDLAAEGARIGFDVLDCLITDITTQAPGLKGSAGEFKTLHAVEFRAAGVSACRRQNYNAIPGDRLPGAGPASEGAQRVSLAGPIGFSYAGQNVGARATGCDVACGNRKSLAPPSGCLCQVGAGRSARWLATR
jgi:hypothetical protein